jgi:hypothetical protein
MARMLRTLLRTPSIWLWIPSSILLGGHRISVAGMTPSGPWSMNPALRGISSRRDTQGDPPILNASCLRGPVRLAPRAASIAR